MNQMPGNISGYLIKDFPFYSKKRNEKMSKEILITIKKNCKALANGNTRQKLIKIMYTTTTTIEVGETRSALLSATEIFRKK